MKRITIEEKKGRWGNSPKRRAQAVCDKVMADLFKKPKKKEKQQ